MASRGGRTQNIGRGLRTFEVDITSRHESIIIGNFVSYWIMGNSVKVSFGEKNINSFSYNDYDVETGRYDEINTVYEFYINDTFWSFVYDWYGMVLLLLSGLVILIIKKFNDLRSVVEKKEDNL